MKCLSTSGNGTEAVLPGGSAQRVGSAEHIFGKSDPFQFSCIQRISDKAGEKFVVFYLHDVLSGGHDGPFGKRTVGKMEHIVGGRQVAVKGDAHISFGTGVGSPFIFHNGLRQKPVQQHLRLQKSEKRPFLTCGADRFFVQQAETFRFGEQAAFFPREIMRLDFLFQMDGLHAFVIDPDPEFAARRDAAQILAKGRVLPVVKINAPNAVSAFRMKCVRLHQRTDSGSDEGDVPLIHQEFLFMTVFSPETFHAVPFLQASGTRMACVRIHKRPKKMLFRIKFTQPYPEQHISPFIPKRRRLTARQY